MYQYRIILGKHLVSLSHISVTKENRRDSLYPSLGSENAPMSNNNAQSPVKGYQDQVISRN